MSHRPIDVAVNPNDQAQRYILWTNGRIDNLGGAPPITGPAWYDQILTLAAALHITDWVSGEGYVLSIYGEFVPVGGAPDIMTGTQTVAGEDRDVMVGVPYFADWHYIDWAWNSDGSGEGYVLDRWGQLRPFGGALDPPRTGPRFTSPIALRLKMMWSTVRAMTLDVHGGMWADFFTQTPTPAYPNKMSPYLDFARDFHINWEDAPVLSGYTLDLNATTWPFGGAPVGSNLATGMWPNSGLASVLEVLSESDPVRMWQVWWGGQQFEYSWSGPPTVTAGGAGSNLNPPSTVTDTTRPVLAWAYSDPQADSQAAWQVLVFTQAFVDAHTMTNPLTWTAQAVVAQEGSQRTARGFTCPVDLPNGTYRMYVRAQDTAGEWSTWNNRGWTQAVTLPSAPTGLTATLDPGTFSVLLSVSASAANHGDLVRFDYSDDGGATWAPVRGAAAVPLGSTTTATDIDPPLGAARTYRATAFSNDPAVASTASATATATLDAAAYVLRSAADPALGGELRVQEPVEWTRPVVAGVFEGIGAEYSTVVSDGAPKAKRTTLHLLSVDAVTLAKVEALALSDAMLIYRDPYGQVMYCRLVGDWQQALMEGAGERSIHMTDLPLVEVAPPGAT